MPPVRVVTSQSQQSISVNDLIKNPLIIPQRISQLLSNQFVMEDVLRNAGKAGGGAVQFRESDGLFADDPSEVVAESAEIPLVTVTRGVPDSARVEKRALGVEITREMRDRNDIGAVNNQLTRVANTLIRDFDKLFVDTLRAKVTQTQAATADWAVATAAQIRGDIIAAKKQITNTQVPNTTSGDQFLGYRPDTITFNPNMENDLLGNANFLAFFLGTTAPTNVTSLPQNILGLAPKITWGVPDGEVWISQSKVVGGYADEIPRETTALYYWEPRQAYRSDTTRSTAVFVDNPKAAFRVTGA